VLEQQLGAEADHAGRGVEPGPEQQHRHAELFLEVLLAGSGLAGGQPGQQVVPAAAANCSKTTPSRRASWPSRSASSSSMASRRPRDSDANGIASSSTRSTGPELADVPRGERAGRDLPAGAVRRARHHHHRAVPAAGERVVPPARIQRVELLEGRRPEGRLAQYPGAAGEGGGQVAGRHPGEADGQERGPVPQLGVERVRVVERARPDQPQEDPQRLGLGGSPGRGGQGGGR
jgi:hypothetical protein